MKQELLDDLAGMDRLTNLLDSAFVAKRELIELMVVCAVAQEHLLIVGPPGTAKSELVKRFSLLCSPPKENEVREEETKEETQEEKKDSKIPYFEYLLTRFTEPAEIFGPVDIQAFQEGGGHHRATDGMLPRAEIAFLDEVFKANSAILNALLTVLNERVFYNGGVPEQVPLLFAIGATNDVPDDSSLDALYDRFLIRVWTDNVEEARFGDLFRQGWKLEKERIDEGYRLKLMNVTTTDAFHRLYKAINDVKVDGIAGDYREVVRRVRAEGIELSDRRVIKLLKLIAASALRRKDRSMKANCGDFWVLRHIWNEQEQIPHLQSIIDQYTGDYTEVQWGAERDLWMIEGDIKVLLATRHDKLKTEADYADFLGQANQLRMELTRHSDEEGRRPLMKRIEELIEEAMSIMEHQS